MEDPSKRVGERASVPYGKVPVGWERLKRKGRVPNGTGPEGERGRCLK